MLQEDREKYPLYIFVYHKILFLVVEDEAELVSGLISRRSSMESPQGQIISVFNEDRQDHLVGNANADVPAGAGVLGPLNTESCIPPAMLG